MTQIVSLERRLQNVESAYEYLKEHGWTKGAFRRMDGTMCAGGAFKYGVPDAAQRDLPSTIPGYRDVLQEARSGPREWAPGRGHYLSSLSQWNDHPERTEAEVHEAFEKAITRLRALIEARS